VEWGGGRAGAGQARAALVEKLAQTDAALGAGGQVVFGCLRERNI
jgi:hypothetical protein